MSDRFNLKHALLGVAGLALIALLGACASSPMPAPAPVRAAAPPAAPVVVSAPPVVSMARVEAPVAQLAKTSAATNARDYRVDAASHLYGQNANRIYQGKMPPLLYAVGVLQVEVDGRGQVAALNWMRAPSQAPEVVAEIERTVRQAAPFPAPVRMGRVTYTDTWLWHKSGRFQLDTLTEGQL